MSRRPRLLSLSAAALALCASGVVASALNDLPQDARPVQDVTADLNRQQQPAPVPPTAPPTPAEPAPEAEPAPAAPVPITPTAPPAQPLTIETGSLDAEDVPEDAPVEAAAKTEAQPVEPTVPARRQRHRVAIVEAVDKVTAERMRFEVPVGGRPIRFQKTLIFIARACEKSTPDELVQDSIAYLEIAVQPRGVLNMSEPRQVFRGWMFASTPGVSGLEHPVYDAWVVDCRA